MVVALRPVFFAKFAGIPYFDTFLPPENTSFDLSANPRAAIVMTRRFQ
jgi:hypothetical protein